MMRTKHYLAALCIPMAFAACSNEEFLNEAPSFEARGTIDVVLQASKPSVDAVETRLGIDGNDFLWEANTDMIGAAMADGTTLGSINGDGKIYINYPFVADQSAKISTFSGKSSIMVGQYLFYYGYQEVVAREKLALDMPTQTYVVADEKSSIEQAVANMKMIAPIVDLANGVTYEDAQTLKLGLQFVNLYTLVKVNLNASNIQEGKVPSVQKVILKAESTNFVKTAKASLTGIAAANVVGLTAEGEIDADAMETAKENLETKVANGSVYSDVTRDDVVLNIDGDLKLAEGTTQSVYFLVPKGTYAQDFKLSVVTTEGTYNRILSGSKTLADDIQPIAADMNFATDGSGNVELPNSFDIETATDWNNTISFLESHAMSYINQPITFKLKDDVEIANLPAFPLTINGETSVKTLTLTKNYTINGDNKDRVTTDTYVKLGVKEGATLTVGAVPSNAYQAGIVNNGTLNMNAAYARPVENNGVMNITAMGNGAISNKGTVNVNDDVTLTAGITNGTVDKNATITVAGTKTLTVNTAALNNVAGSSVNIAASGKLVLGVASTNAGTIVNNGTVTVNVSLNNTGTLENRGTVDGAVAVVNNATIDNFGALTANVTNNGKVVVEESGIGACTITGGTVEVKNITTFTTTQSVPATKYTFAGAPVVTTEVNNKAEYVAADGVSVGITNITLNGGDWTLAAAAGDDDSKTVAAPSNAEGLTLKNANLILSANLDDKDIIVEGNSSVAVAANAQKITKANLTVNANAKLVVKNKVTVNATNEFDPYNAAIKGELVVEAGAAMYFKTARVGENDNSDAKLTVYGDVTTPAAIAAGKFGADQGVNNWGTVTAVAGASGESGRGKVSPTTQMSTQATLKGNTTLNPSIFI